MLATQGYPLPLVDMRAVGDDGEAPWDGKTVGEIQVRGPWITGSYHDQPAPENFTDDGWLRTGDVASIDALGFMKITDRTKDLIKSGGEWISSVDLENAIMGHPAVQEAAVIAVPHPEVGRAPAGGDRAASRGAQATEARHPRAPVEAVREVDGARCVCVRRCDPAHLDRQVSKTKLREQYRDWKWPTKAIFAIYSRRSVELSAMNFELSDEQKLIQHTAREFARREIQPVAAQCDREARFPMEVFDKAREVGLVNMTRAAASSAAAAGALLDLALVTEELAWACTGIAGALGLNSIFADVFHVAGTRAAEARGVRPAAGAASSAPTR